MMTKYEHNYGEKGYITATNGMNFVVGPYGVVSRTMLRNRVYEPDVQNLLKDACKKDLLSIDVGAHIGTNTYVMCKHSKIVLAFEPASDFFPILEKNIALNQISMSNARAFQLALGSKKGKTDFIPDAFSAITINETEVAGPVQGNLKEETCGSGTKGSIDIVCGDDFLIEQGYTHSDVGLIKIDVEGYEGPVLEGFKKIIEASKPAIYLELHDGKNAQVGINTVKQSLALMKEYGYERIIPSQDLNANSLWAYEGWL